MLAVRPTAVIRDRRLPGSLPAATLSLTGTESGLTTATLLTTASGSCRTLSSESWAALGAIPVVSGLTVPTVPMRLHSRVAAEMTVPALTDREIGSATFLFLSFDTRQLRANQRAVHRAFFDVGSRILMFLVLFDRRRLMLIDGRL